MSKQTSQMANNALEVSVQRHPGCKVDLNVTVAPEFLKKCYQKAIKNVSKQISIPGFRKGKAPEDLITKHYNQALKKEWGDVIANDCFRHAVSQSKCYPNYDERVSTTFVTELQLDQPVEISYKFEVFPDVPHFNPAELLLKHVEVKPIPERLVDYYVRHLLLEEVKWEELPEDHAIEAGDYVTLKVYETHDKEAEPEVVNEALAIECNQEMVHSWLYDRLIGKKVGEVVDLKSPENDSVDLGATILKIRKGTLPEVDEDFLRKVHCPSLEHLKTSIREKLNQTRDAKIQENYRQQVMEALDGREFEVPASVLDAQCALILQTISGMNQKDEKIQEEVRRVAASYIRREYLLASMKNRLQINIPPEMFEHYINEHILEYLQARKETLSTEENYGELVKRFSRKAESEALLDYCVEHASKSYDAEESLKFGWAPFLGNFYNFEEPKNSLTP